MTGLNEIENVYGETVEFYDLSALSQIGNKKIVLNKFADMVKDLVGYRCRNWKNNNRDG